jgi:GDP-mannose 6-dehydrogenase
MTRIGIFGLGYVGTVSAACFAAQGHKVIGVDPDVTKVEAINAGRSPVIELGMDALVHKGVECGRLSATTDSRTTAIESDVLLVCVGTPSRRNGGLDLRHVLEVTRQIGEARRDEDDYYVVVYRSTLLPGTVEQQLIPLLAETSRQSPGVDFGVAVNPEFLREGTSIKDFYDPPRTVVGELDVRSGEAVARLYEDIPGPLVRTSIKTAEMLKYADNAFHALKVVFANEIGNICKRDGIDSHELMEIFCLDTKLNLSSTYLKSGFAFGGSCLPKDVRALMHRARMRDLRVPLLDSILASNELQKRLGLEMVLRTKKRKIGILGLSFKPGTDDLRESPAVELAEALIGKGFNLAIYDKNVSLARLVGANRAFIEREIPHISSLMRSSLEEVRSHAEVLVVTTHDPEFLTLLPTLAREQMLIDLVRLVSEPPGNVAYEGICW